MKTIIAGSRDFESYAILYAVMQSVPWEITEVVSGCARGVDTMGENWAGDNRVPVKKFPAEWKTYGKCAGYLRNNEMANYADALVAIRFQGSKGTLHMLDLADQANLKIYKVEILINEL